jgi:hypothetical protein
MIQALAIVIVLLLGAVGYQTVRVADEQASHERTKTDCATVKQRLSDELAAKTTAARVTEQALQADANQARRATDEAVAELTRQRDAIRADRLRIAANRVRPVPVPSPAPTAGTSKAEPRDLGAELSGAIAGAEEDEALRAGVIQENLKSCYAQYDSAREKLARASK